jgi:hypothetical protein
MNNREIFLFIIIFLQSIFFPILSFAQSTEFDPSTFDPNQNYTSSDILQIARQRCTQVLTGEGLSSAFEGADQFGIIEFPPTPGTGGAVTINNRALLENVANTVNLLGKILKQIKERNFSEDCFKSLALARGVQAIKKDLEKTQKKIANENLNKPETVARQTSKKVIADRAEELKKGNDPQKSARLSVISSVLSPKEKKSPPQDAAQKIENCASGKSIIRLYGENNCWKLIEKGYDYESSAINEAQNIYLNTGNYGGNVILQGLLNGGVVAGSRCLETKDGSDPSLISGRDVNCKTSEEEPVIVTQEKVKQLINAPYDQAFSPAGENGIDGGFYNINQRIQDGNLFEKNISPNFRGGKSDKSTSTNTLLNDEKVKNQIIDNLKRGILVEKALKEYYASSTSHCIYVAVIDRQKTIQETDEKINSFQIEVNKINQEWEKVVKNPNQDHTKFLVNLSILLSTKWGDSFIKKEVENFKVKAQKCIDAKK